MKDGLFQIGELRIAGSLDCQVLVFLPLISNPRFAIVSRQSVKIGAALYVLFNYLLDQGLLEFAVLSIEVIALVSGQHAGHVADVSPNTLSG
ncbi:hypothetical protein [Pseudomonas sp. DC3000-4b1]|uniref:hypothetical protein n=1 Tax=unclassified Pseudomonas TaxID=196821 RepID=UPI003CF46A24